MENSEIMEGDTARRALWFRWCSCPGSALLFQVCTATPVSWKNTVFGGSIWAGICTSGSAFILLSPAAAEALLRASSGCIWGECFLRSQQGRCWGSSFAPAHREELFCRVAGWPLLHLNPRRSMEAPALPKPAPSSQAKQLPLQRVLHSSPASTLVILSCLQDKDSGILPSLQLQLSKQGSFPNKLSSSLLQLIQLALMV